MAEKIYESTEKEGGKFKLECQECFFENLIENAEKDDVIECADCGAPFTIVEVTDDKSSFKPLFLMKKNGESKYKSLYLIYDIL